MRTCYTSWGTHGCELDADVPHTVHECISQFYGPCAQFDEERPVEARVRSWIGNRVQGKWGNWLSWEGWEDEKTNEWRQQ